MFDTDKRDYITTEKAPKFIGKDRKVKLNVNKDTKKIQLGESKTTAAFSLGNGGMVYLTPEQVVAA